MGNCNIKVMMFGGRRCGKTSVIAAMKQCIEEKFGDSSLIMTYDNPTIEIITKKAKEIRGFLNGTEKTFVPDEGTTVDESEYNFEISLKGKNGTIGLTFYDYPGEWLSRAERQKTLKEHVNNSNIFIIAIDTPLLIEEPDEAHKDKIGRFNDDSNKPEIVCNTIKSVLKDRGTPDFPPLVMFVPLKCEKYYNEGKMNVVNKKVHAAYRSLFDFFGGDNESNYEVVIAPILTFGKDTAQFSRFEYDDNGKIILGTDGLPEKSLYIRIGTQPYSPLYCEQPLLYSLEYLLHMARKQKEAEYVSGKWFTNFFKSLFDSLRKLPNAKDFLEQEKAIRKKLRKDDDGDGYEIVHNPMKL